MKQYSKTSSFYRSTKLDYFSENEKHLQKARDINKIYMAQPKRQCCKICETSLPKNVDFNSHEIDYIFCTNCNHLNGIYDDTISFVKEIYLKDDGDNYATEYFDEKYLQRTKDIYLPKVEFLDSSVQEKNYKVLDVGCGSGYFVLGCLLKNISINGFDVSKKQIEFGNNRINSHKEQKKPLYAVTEEAFFDEIKSTNADVISAIGVIEHLREPQKFFKAFKLSGAKYLFYSVPMFSFSVVLENMFKNVYPRHLHGDHTHLFTEQSIKELNNRLGVKSVNEWRFGADIMDLYRATLLNLQKNNSSPKMIRFFDEGFATKIDEMQSVLDMNHFCSEIHVVAAKL